MIFYYSDISEQSSKRHSSVQRSNTVLIPSSDSDSDCDAIDFKDVLSSSDIDYDLDEEGESEENNRKKRPLTCKRRGKSAYKKPVRY